MATGDHAPHGKPGNLRTALILASIAAVFFAGYVARRWLLG